ncbi:MAG: PKD domain-containing protein, partial [Bacteroidota bacterium]
MKKLLFQIMFLLLVIPAFSQGFVTVNGTVTDITTGTPIANHAVTIQSDSTTGFIYYQTVYTNASGFYSDTVIVTLGVTGTLFIRTYDCNNVLHQDVFNYTPYQSHTSTFVICNTNTGGCQAAFTYSAGGSNLVQFTDQSTGSPSVVAWSWAFGDPLSGVNNVSNLQNPVHIYGAPGTYTTCLTIQSANGCSNTTCQTIVVNATGGCQAAYTYVNTGGTQYQFNDQSSGNIISWLWNFGDPASGANGTSTAQNPTHTYSSPGIYTTCLTVHGSDSTCYDVVCQTIVAGSGGNCQAQFSYIIPLGGPPTVVEFTDLSTTASGAITTWIWNFGDGSVQTVSFPGNPNVSHTYAQNGNYAVCLTIHGTDSTCFDTKCDTLFLGNSTGCHANFYTSVPTPANSPVLFMDASTTGGSGQIASWNWNFGDPTSGSANTSTLQNPSHTYISAGSYTVCLTIHGADSTCYDMICKTVIVEGNQGCQANFSYTCTAPTFTNVQFTDLSTGNPTGWMWNFGDGTASTLQNPAHTFATAGNFNVCLTITGNNCTSTFCRIVVVSDSTNYHQLYGQVFAGTFPVSLGMVMIFSFDTTANYQPFVEVSPIDSNGVYYFTLVPDGNYYILAIPFDSNGFLPTYYGNVISWQQASLISLGTPANPYNISLVPSDQMTGGPGSASG